MSTLSTFEVLQIYKANVLKFLDSLVELFPEESDMIVMRILFETQVPIEESMRRFSSRLLSPMVIGEETILPAELIRKRNDKFFLQNVDFFQGVDKSKIIRWRQLWQSKRLDSGDRNAIWSWLDLFLGLAEMYIANDAKQS